MRLDFPRESLQVLVVTAARNFPYSLVSLDFQMPVRLQTGWSVERDRGS